MKRRLLDLDHFKAINAAIGRDDANVIHVVYFDVLYKHRFGLVI